MMPKKIEQVNNWINTHNLLNELYFKMLIWNIRDAINILGLLYYVYELHFKILLMFEYFNRICIFSFLVHSQHFF